MRIGVIGAGVVGQATARCWLEYADEVRVWDIIRERRFSEYIDVLGSDIIFVCIPETEVDKYFGEYVPTAEGWRGRNFVLKSTVPIGTTRRLREQYGLKNLVHSPEFLTARCAATDAQMPARNIIGIPHGGADGQHDAMVESDQDRWLKKHHPLIALYTSRFPGVQTLLMSSDESEAVKLATNAFFATKISFFNEVHELCQDAHLDWETVLAGILSDGRISHSHTKVPGPDGQEGYGGRCLPKDLAHFVKELKDRDLHCAVSEAAKTWQHGG